MISNAGCEIKSKCTVGIFSSSITSLILCKIIIIKDLRMVVMETKLVRRRMDINISPVRGSYSLREQIVEVLSKLPVSNSWCLQCIVVFYVGHCCCLDINCCEGLHTCTKTMGDNKEICFRVFCD